MPPKIGKITVNDNGKVEVADTINHYGNSKDTKQLLDKHKILYLSACPSSLDDLRFTDEVTAIKSAIEKVGREKVEAEYELNVPIDDFLSMLQRYNPEILHISAHGHIKNGLLFIDDINSKKSVAMSQDEFFQTINSFLSLKNTALKLVVISACNSKGFAEAIGTKIPAIGMNGFLPEVAANLFATNFYKILLSSTDILEVLSMAISQSKTSLKRQKYNLQSGIEVHEMPVLFNP